MNNTNSVTKYIISTIVVVAVIAGVIGFAYSHNNMSSGNSDNNDSVGDVVSGIDNDGMDADTGDVSGDNVSGATSTQNQTTNKYKDGSYTANGSYPSPAGPETIGVTLVIRNDTIIDATVIGNAKNATSVKYQQKFISGFKTLVVGKNIDSIKLDKVSGSSLTPNGFNSALATIKAEAQV